MKRTHLQNLSREELIREAEGVGVPRPRVLTQAELVDEILQRTVTSERERSRSRGWLGRARDLLATVVEKGLHLPDAAAAIRSGSKGWPPAPPPIATVTLAEIYAAQGHLARAVAVLDDVLAREPEHQEAAELRERFRTQIARSEAASAAPAAAPKRDGQDRENEIAKDVGTSDEASPQIANTGFSEPSQGLDASAASNAQAASIDAANKDVTSPESQIATAPAGDESDSQVVATTDTAAPRTADADAAPEEAQAAPDGAAVVSDISASAAIVEPSSEVDASASPTEKGVSDATADDDAEAPAPLPERYDVDEVVALAVDPSTFYVYWEVRATTFAHMIALGPSGSMALRVVAITPGWDGPIVETRDILIDALFGDRFVHHVRPRADVRVSVGWLEGEKFDPIAVGTEVSAPRAFASAGGPSVQGAPLNLSDGLHALEGGSHRAVQLYASRTERARSANVVAEQRGGESVATGFVPRELSGHTIDPAPERQRAGWIWVPSSSLVLAKGADGATSLSSTDGGYWVRTEEVTRGWGGASEVAPRWGGASEVAPRWGGASEVAPRWGGAS